MGAPMARNLLKGGFTVTVWARRADAMASLVSAGAAAADSSAHVASSSDIVMTMVTDTRAVEDVLLGERGVASGARPGLLVVDHSTIDPDATKRIAGELQARGIEMLDAQASLDRATPALSCYAKSIVHIGTNGAGQVAKACNQICTIVNQLGAAEAMLLAEHAGVDPRAVKEALMGGFAASRMLDLQAPKMIARDFEGKVESRLHHKDIRIVLDMARSLGIELPASAAAADVLERLQQRGGARQDSAAIFGVLDAGSLLEEARSKPRTT
jgi:2-hydroxy-3-oxopropionate reductase